MFLSLTLCIFTLKVCKGSTILRATSSKNLSQFWNNILVSIAKAFVKYGWTTTWKKITLRQTQGFPKQQWSEISYKQSTKTLTIQACRVDPVHSNTFMVNPDPHQKSDSMKLSISSETTPNNSLETWYRIHWLAYKKLVVFLLWLKISKENKMMPELHSKVVKTGEALISCRASATRTAFLSMKHWCIVHPRLSNSIITTQHSGERSQSFVKRFSR